MYYFYTKSFQYNEYLIRSVDTDGLVFQLHRQ